MTPENFCYWLQGMFELSPSRILSEKQIGIIKEHLQLVFNKQTPTTPIEITHEIDARKIFEKAVEDVRTKAKDDYWKFGHNTPLEEKTVTERQQVCQEVAYANPNWSEEEYNRTRQDIRMALARQNLDTSDLTVDEIMVSRGFYRDKKYDPVRPPQGLKHVNKNIPLGFSCNEEKVGVHANILKFADGPQRSC